MSAETANFLWNDTTFFEDRYEKSALALVAIRQSLVANPILGDKGQEFLKLYISIAALPPDLFIQVWADPTAYFWSRNAYELTKICMTEAPLPNFFKQYGVAIQRSEPKEILAWHLQDFKKFALAAHYLAHQDCLFDPYVPLFPLAIPGTCLFLEADGSVAIHGLIHNELIISCAGAIARLPLKPGATLANGCLRVGECPVVRQNHYELPLQVYSFKLPAFVDSKPALDAGLDYQVQQTNLVQDTLVLIERYHPRTFDQLRQFIRLIAFKPRDAGDYGNLSYSDLPGALICSAVFNAYEFAEMLIHEFHHNRLFFIEEISPILLNSVDESDVDDCYYSPWRNDLRPLRGLFHALYVYTPVCQFWFNVYQSGGPDKTLLDYACSQLIILPLQLQIGIWQLEHYGVFSEMGQELFPELKATVAELLTAIAALDLSPDIPTMVYDETGQIVHLRDRKTNKPLFARERVLLHVRECDRNHQCDDLLKKLSLV